MKVSSVEEMKNMDKQAMEKFGIPDSILMENAGQAAYFVILKEFGIDRKKFIVLCGTGNNGGDGLVVARKLHSMGAEVKVYILGEKKYGEAAAKNFEILSRMPIEIKPIDLDRMRIDIAHSDAIIDAIFGTGLSKNVKGMHREAVKLINESGKVVFSVDIPSGINGNTGRIMGEAVKADYTITYGLPKIGNILYPGYEWGGKLYLSHISFPPSLQNSIKVSINDPIEIPERKRMGIRVVLEMLCSLLVH
jgi:yjeF N-terminal region